MKKIIFLQCCLALSSCAYYHIDAITPTGAKLQGTALVANNSDQVALTVKNGDFEASFGKTSTDGTSIIDALRRALTTEEPPQ